jgi:sugar phosphate isomerase/epimerase
VVRRTARLAAVAVAGMLLLGACGGDDDATAATTTTIPAVSEVGQRRPWDGVIVQPPAGPAAANILGEELAELDDLGAPNIGLVVPLLQADPTDVPHADPSRTPTDDALGLAVDRARERGLGVVLELRVEGTGDQPADAGAEDPARWFSAYGSMASHYAELAQRHGVALFVIGVAAGPLVQEADGWSGVLDAVRQRYDGSVSFATGLERLEQVTFWDGVDVIGVEVGQPPTTDEADPITSDLEKAWEPVLDRLTELAERWSRPVVLTRIGFAAEPESDEAGTDDPTADQSGLGRSAADDEQGRGYQALFTVINQTPAVDGVLVWHWGSWTGAEGSAERSYSPEGRPAEDVLRRAWTTPLAHEEPTESTESHAPDDDGTPSPGSGTSSGTEGGG